MLRKTTTFILFSILTINVAFSQAEQGNDLGAASITDITTVAAIGAAGAVLGLSTLSFVEEPKDHFKNVLIGGAIGIIIGVGVVAFKQAGVSQKQYIESQGSNQPHFNTSQRFVWHRKKHNQLNSKIGQQYSQFQYAISF